MLRAGRRARKQLAATVEVARKAARRQHGAAAGPHRHLAVRCVDDRALYHAVVGQQALRRRGHPQFYPEIISGLQQPGDQGGAVDQLHALPPGGQVEDMESDPPACVDERLRGAGGVQKCLQVRPGHDAHAQERGLVQLRSQLVQQVPAEPAGVDRFRTNRPSPGAGAGHVSLDIRDPGAADELQRGVLLEKRHHMRPGLEQRIHPGRVVMLAEHVLEVGTRTVHVFDDPVRLREGVQRDPRPPARPRRRPAAHPVLFHHHDAQPVPGRRGRGRQTARSRPDDQQVTFGLSGVPHRASSRSGSSACHRHVPRRILAKALSCHWTGGTLRQLRRPGSVLA